MKKIIISAVAVAIALIANAAAIDWSAGGIVDVEATAAAGKVTPASGWLGYVVMAADLSTVKTDLDKGSTQSLVEKAVGPVKTIASKGKFTESTASGNVAAGSQDFYLVVLNAGTAAEAKKYFVSEKVTVEVDASMDTSIGFPSQQTASASAAAWASVGSTTPDPAPEPTSGLLLLLGMAGLALKRKRA